MSGAANDGKWTVEFSSKAAKQYIKLPQNVQEQLNALIKDIEESGPVRGNWRNYSKLSDIRHHCHIKRGKPTYVACWEVTDGKAKIVEVYYAGTHEKAPY